MDRDLSDSGFGFDVFFVFFVNTDERYSVLFLYVGLMQLANLVDTRTCEQCYQEQPEPDPTRVVGANLVIVATVVNTPRV